MSHYQGHILSVPWSQRRSNCPMQGHQRLSRHRLPLYIRQPYARLYRILPRSSGEYRWDWMNTVQTQLRQASLFCRNYTSQAVYMYAHALREFLYVYLSKYR